MTNQEIINEIKCLLSELNNGEDAVSYLTRNDVKWLNENIKALEQEPVIDKIRAEIIELTKCPYGTECLGANCPSNTDCMICGDHVLDILDKYKAESEDE